MREIKFRAWDRRSKCWISKGTIFRLTIERNIVSDIDWVDWLQYTGLKDKNGKEIYEGDILKHNYGGTEFAQVTFHDCSFYTGGVLLQNNHSSVIEVIGNIYENPELLN